MVIYTKEERTELVLLCANRSLRETANAFAAKYPHRPKPATSTIAKIVSKFKETGSIANRKRINRPRPATGEDMQMAVLARVSAMPTKSSTRVIAEEAGIGQSSVLRILH